MATTNVNFKTDKFTQFTVVSNILGIPIFGTPADGETISYNATQKHFEFKPFAPPALLAATTTKSPPDTTLN